MRLLLLLFLLFSQLTLLYAQGNPSPKKNQKGIPVGAGSSFSDASLFGFSPKATGIQNAEALQQAVKRGGTVIVSQPGTYAVAATVYLGSNTTLLFGDGVFLKKVDERGSFSHVFVNKGAKTKTYDEHISIIGLNIIVNGIDVRKFEEAYGLHGQLAFFYIRDLKIERFRCLDLGKMQYGIHICTFEDILINDVIIKGEKDGVHLGRGKRFIISNGVFQTFDDAVALNAHDYSTGNPELGWIENGIVEKCYDLNAANTTGYFCRILAGAWTDWKPGMEVQRSDAVVANGRIYRVQVEPDGKKYTSLTRPAHASGKMVIDGITWGVVQEDVTYTAGVRNVVFRDIFLEKPRTAFSVHFDNDKYSRSYYPGAEVPLQQQLVFDNIRVLYNEARDFLSISTPVDVLTITNSSFKSNRISFYGNKAMQDYLKTKININSCVFTKKGEMELIANSVDGKQVVLQTASNMAVSDDFTARVNAGNGNIVVVSSDLPGLSTGSKR